MGTDTPLPAAEPVGIAGGRPAPAPAAAASPMSSAAPSRFDALGPGTGAMDRFVLDYLDLLDGRLLAIRRCMVDSDVEGARIAVLSLESSSKMLGATELAGQLTELRSQLMTGPTPQLSALLSLIEGAAESFRHHLQQPHAS